MRIPGYDEALAEERKLREEAFLASETQICGIPIKQITPRLLAVLCRIQTPFLGSGSDEISEARIMQFLWALHPENPMRVEKKRLFRKTRRDRFFDSFKSGFDFTEAERQIWEFLDATFLDSPQDAKAVPYTSSIAWLIYSMSGAPFHWSREYTLDRPLREIYQLIRCRAADNRETLVNQKSDKLRSDFLAKLQAEMFGKSPEEQVAILNRANTGGLN